MGQSGATLIQLAVCIHLRHHLLSTALAKDEKERSDLRMSETILDNQYLHILATHADPSTTRNRQVETLYSAMKKENRIDAFSCTTMLAYLSEARGGGSTIHA